MSAMVTPIELSEVAPALTDDELAFQALIYRHMATLLDHPKSIRSLRDATEELRAMFRDDAEEAATLDDMLASLHEIEDSDPIEIERDHAALFIGALKMLAPPYASYHLDGQRQLNGPSTLKIAQAFEGSGLKHAPLRNRPADHIATMLEYLFELLRRALEDDDRRDMFVDDARMFFKSLLLPWIEPFSESVEANARTAFYANLGRSLPKILIADSLLI